MTTAPVLPFPKREPPRAAQFNWLSGEFETVPEQIPLPLPPVEEAELPDDGTAVLLATENGAQLLVSGFGLSVGRKSERVVVRRGGKTCAELPILRLQELVIGSRGISISSDVIEEMCTQGMCTQGMRISFLTSSGKPFALLTSPLLTATVETRRSQFAASASARGVVLARWIVAGKLHNQERLLRYFAKSRTGETAQALTKCAGALRALRKQALEVDAPTIEEARPRLMGYEGTGGRLYWQQIAKLVPEESGFQGRQHQGPQDAVNAALNYGYGILYGHVWGAIMNAGLEPFAGLLHVDRSGKPSLVLDLVEEFRQPVVDRPLLAWLNKGGQVKMQGGLLDSDSRQAVATRVMMRLQAREAHRGKNHEVRSIIQMQARLLASAVRGDREYRPFAFKW